MNCEAEAYLLSYRSVSIILYKCSLEVIHFVLDYLRFKVAERFFAALEFFVTVLNGYRFKALCGALARQRKTAFLHFIDLF